MNTELNLLEKSKFPLKLSYIITLLKKDLVFTIAFFLAIVSCFINTPKLDYIDFKVIISLFNLMVVIKALEELKVLEKIAVSMINRCKSKRTISTVLTFLCFFAAMLITNDVALITFVPLTLIISKKANINMLDTIILQTIAANIGSSLTPMGNPQNLYIYSFYELGTQQFFKTVFVIILAGMIWLYMLNIKIKKKSLTLKLENISLESKSDLIEWLLLFLFIMLSVFKIVDYRIALVLTVLTAIHKNKKILFQIDYILLMTFVCFFIFIGNISNVKLLNDFLQSHLNNSYSTFSASIILSQLISNVPCSILLSHFTINWNALLLGVNIGGTGTLIASLASLISYKLYIKENPTYMQQYIKMFTFYNLITLALLTAVGIIIL